MLNTHNLIGFAGNALNMNYEPSNMNHLLPAIFRQPKKSLYHNRTPAVTEAYASIRYFRFKLLKNSNLICGTAFYKQ
jgi:hypothetical protein